MKKINVISILLLFLFLFTSICLAEDYKVDYDFTKLRFDMERSVGYHSTNVGIQDILYFSSSNLSSALSLLDKDRASLLKMLIEKKRTEGFDIRIIEKYFSKAAILAYLFYLDNKQAVKTEIMYRTTLVKYKNTDFIALAKYKIGNNEIFPIEFESVELELMKKTRVRESNDIDYNYTICSFNGQNTDTAFRFSNSHWTIVGSSQEKLANYLFNIYLVKSGKDIYKDFIYYVVNGLDYLYYRAYDQSTKYESIEESYEICIPELGFYWNSELPGLYYVDYKEVKANK